LAVKMPAKSRPEPTLWRKGWLIKSTLLIVVIAAFLGGVIAAGHWGLEQIQGDPRYEFAFADIECEPPPGMTKQDFLDEVRYGPPSLPARLNLLDEELPKKLRDGFVKHAWVEKVERVEIKPSKQIVVTLTYRTPVLAVKVGSDLRVVDGNGVLLPRKTATLGLPIYDGIAKPPTRDEAGTRWGDANVEAAARKVKIH
jgi:hypothetical protein